MMDDQYCERGNISSTISPAEITALEHGKCEVRDSMGEFNRSKTMRLFWVK